MGSHQPVAVSIGAWFVPSTLTEVKAGARLNITLRRAGIVSTLIVVRLTQITYVRTRPCVVEGLWCKYHTSIFDRVLGIFDRVLG